MENNELDEFDGTEGKIPVDNYLEHSLHSVFDSRCSECHKENKIVHTTGVDLTNQKQESNLSKLRASIEAQRALRHSVIEVPDGNIKDYKAPELEMCLVPIITEPNNTEFSLERHTQLCQKVDVLYHNYLCIKSEMFVGETVSVMSNEKMEQFESALHDLCVGVDEVVSESVKIRFH